LDNIRYKKTALRPEINKAKNGHIGHLRHVKKKAFIAEGLF
jgi:hypothetical protein